jgi:sulfite reductase alpha subunit-like flavoprotein
LKNVRFGIFGLGGAVYEDKWCKPAKDLEAAMLALGATMLLHTGETREIRRGG